jgi:hypothetical protein
VGLISWEVPSHSCIECKPQKTWIPMNEVVGGFIAPNRFLAVGKDCWRWAHRTATMHCSVRATSAQPLGFGAVDRWSHLSSSCTGQYGATPDSPMPSDFCRGTVHHCSSVQLIVGAQGVVAPLAHRTVRCHTGQSNGTPDSPVNYNGACPRIPESG